MDVARTALAGGEKVRAPERARYKPRTAASHAAESHTRSASAGAELTGVQRRAEEADRERTGGGRQTGQKGVENGRKRKRDKERKETAVRQVVNCKSESANAASTSHAPDAH